MIRTMSSGPIQRVTAPTVEVLRLLLQAHEQGAEVHGWSIARQTGRPSPTVYKILERLAEAGWIIEEWEIQPPDVGTPRRCFVRLNERGADAARAVLGSRRAPHSPGE